MKEKVFNDNVLVPAKSKEEVRKTKKPRKKKKRKKKNYLLRIIIFIAVVVGMYNLLSSEMFDIDQVQVENNNYYTVEQIKDKAGVKIGQNIFKFKKSDLKEKLLKDPYFENVVIKRKFPSTILIDVTERTEMAYIKKAGKFVIIDPNGLVLRVADSAPTVTEIKGLSIKKPTAGKALEAEESSILTDTLEMMQIMAETDVYFKKIDIASVTVRAYIYDQLICEGTPENMTNSLKNGNLETVIYEMYSKGIERGVLRVGSDNYCAFDPNVE